MAVCTLTLTSVSEGLFLLLLRVAGIGTLLLRILRIRALALDSGVPLNLWLLLRRLVSRSFPFIVCSPFAGLLGMVETTEACCPDIADLLDNGSQVHTCDGFLPEIAFKEALVDRFLTRVSGQQEVGKENDGGHLRTDHGSWNHLVVMHE